MIKNYDCRNSYIKVDSIDYIIELDKGEQCFRSCETLKSIEDFENAYIILYRGLQFIGNALLIKKFKLKSKSKNCQFQYLFDEKEISLDMIDKISEFAEIRNHIYYNNISLLAEISKDEYITRYNLIMGIVAMLRGKL
jgi:hypothetical protein